MQNHQRAHTGRSPEQTSPTTKRTGKSSPTKQPKPERHMRRIEAWEFRMVSTISTHASWYIAIIQALTGQTVTVTREGKKRYLSVGPFAGDQNVAGIEVEVYGKLMGKDPLEQALEVLCNRIYKVTRKRAQALTFDELWSKAG